MTEVVTSEYGCTIDPATVDLLVGPDGSLVPRCTVCPIRAIIPRGTACSQRPRPYHDIRDDPGLVQERGAE